MQEELFSEQNVKVGLSNNNVSADITFNPYTLLLIDDQKEGELKFRFNNYLVDKNEIWEGYDVNSTPHWNSDADTQMYDYLMNDYIPDSETKDDIYRNAVIKLTGLSDEPELIMEKELVNNDGTKQCEEPKTMWDPEKGEYVIELKGNGWQEFRLVLNDSAPKVDKTELKALIDTANGLNEADYTAESFAVMKSALASAQAVYENEQAAEAEVKEAEADLRSAVDALVKSDISEETPGTDDAGKNPNGGGTGGTTDKTGGDKEADGSPQTGDNVSTAGIVAVMAAAIAVFGAVVVRRKKVKQVMY